MYQVPKSLPYKDVPVTTWYAPTLAYLVEKGVVGQDGERLFHPERLVKRSEIAKLVFDYMTLNDREGIKAYAASLIDYYHLDGYRTIVNQAFFTSSGSVLDGVSPLTNVETR